MSKTIQSRLFFVFKFGFARVVDWLRLLGLVVIGVRHLHGPKTIAIEKNEAIVLCVVKDGESLIEPFIKYYLGIGFQHIFFLDNGSTDNTVSLIKSVSQTTLVQSTRPFNRYAVVFKNYLIQQFGTGKWCLVADVDEFFHLPLNAGLANSLDYLNNKGYDAVCTQMLDMLSPSGIALSHRHRVWTQAALTAGFCYYDLNNISKRPYIRSFQKNIPAGLSFLWGGIRKTAFNRNCFLTKEAFFFAYKSKLFPWLGGQRCFESSHLLFSHPLRQVKLADFSAVFLHYKFIDDFYTSTLKAVEAENHWKKSQEYKAYHQVLTKEKENKTVLTLCQPSSFRLKDIDDLIEQDFLFVSDEFRQSL